MLERVHLVGCCLQSQTRLANPGRACEREQPARGVGQATSHADQLLLPPHQGRGLGRQTNPDRALDLGSGRRGGGDRQSGCLDQPGVQLTGLLGGLYVELSSQCINTALEGEGDCRMVIEGAAGHHQRAVGWLGGTAVCNPALSPLTRFVPAFLPHQPVQEPVHHPVEGGLQVLPLGHDPIVVEARQQLPLIEGGPVDQLRRRPGVALHPAQDDHVHPAVGRRIERDVDVVGKEIGLVAALVGLDGPADSPQSLSQVAARVGLRCLGPEETSQHLAAVRDPGGHRQVGEE